MSLWLMRATRALGWLLIGLVLVGYVYVVFAGSPKL